jgi:hypothetical protein
MNKCRDILNLVSSGKFSDRALLAILNPSAKDRDRSAHVTEKALCYMPQKTASDWRLDVVAGHVIPKDEKSVVSNFFMFRDQALQEVIFQYDVKIYQYRWDSASGTYYVEAEDKAHDSDLGLNYSLIRDLRERVATPTNWTAASGFGITYDGHSTLFSTKQLFHPGELDISRVPLDCESNEFTKAMRCNKDGIYGDRNDRDHQTSKTLDFPLLLGRFRGCTCPAMQ